MKDVFLVNYKVNGIKTIDSVVSLSFYKKTVTIPTDTQDYNIKGIYGMNGSGKSAIITSIDILRNLLVNEDYLNNPVVQKNLEAIINKKVGELYIEAEFLANMPDGLLLYKYEVALKRNHVGKFVIDIERLSFKHPNRQKEKFDILIEVIKGEIIQINMGREGSFDDIFTKKTINLLSNATVSALFIKKIFNPDEIPKDGVSFLFIGFLALFIFGTKIHVYMDQSDNHTDYFLRDMLSYSGEFDSDDSHVDFLLKSAAKIDQNILNVFSVSGNLIPKDMYENYANTVRKLEGFIKIFKPDLTEIEIDRKEDGEKYVCSLNMVYGTYSINTEFESTGIKKLIKLFAYLQEMAQGGMVFIDEFDSNIHDVYLCALLEYLMDYGKGQLCFTTHNVGPMDILKKHKKSIDFLSFDHKIYPWTRNGNYSPSKLYKNGMIEGSPFNVESIDFIGIFDFSEGDD